MVTHKHKETIVTLVCMHRALITSASTVYVHLYVHEQRGVGRVMTKRVSAIRGNFLMVRHNKIARIVCREIFNSIHDNDIIIIAVVRGFNASHVSL